MSWAIRIGGTAAVSAILLAAFIVVAASGDDDPPVTSATIDIHFSKFSTGLVTVPAGTPITFTLVNDDPIAHEWIVGDATTHARHRTGAEPHHDGVPTEVTINPFETKVTTVSFATPGDYLFVCHLPGHEEYGMHGIVRVVKAK